MSYTPAYYLAWGVGILGVVAGVLSGYGHYASSAPSWLTPDVQATAAIISGICVGLAALLPQIGRTPGNREASYLAAAQGQLPPDLAKQHPTLIPGAPPTRPLDTL